MIYEIGEPLRSSLGRVDILSAALLGRRNRRGTGGSSFGERETRRLYPRTEALSW